MSKPNQEPRCLDSPSSSIGLNRVFLPSLVGGCGKWASLGIDTPKQLLKSLL